MAVLRGLSTRCITYEVYLQDARGIYTITPFSSALAASGRVATQAITKMRMVQEIGWPEAKRVLADDYGHPLIVKKDEFVWLLKCKPSCWRLYFYVWENGKEKRIIYLHAVCKKQQAEDPREAAHARTVHDGIRRCGSGITLFEFPVD
jgi:hypothetical protein